HRILWQTTAGWIHSGTDFFITDAGLVGSETTIGGFEGFDTNGIPEFARMRRATQDAGSLDQWCAIMKTGNNGGYANAWLLGDVNTREIARLELGLRTVAYEKKRNGFFIGSNVAENRKLLKLETERNDVDIRLSSVARRVRWKQLMKQHAGKVDLELAKKFEADHFDTYRGKVFPGGRTLCGHFERDPDAGGHGVPFDCSGTVDGKVVDAAMAKQMSFAARWGTACGTSFNGRKFLEAHPQFDWMTDLLKDRPAEPWVNFKAGE
ncbi:MAG TPA: peptidase C45, partial [Verrucomicrobiae bacterium]|nr:peptidase C45 [Verrucomicrobiae bacterium]